MNGFIAIYAHTSYKKHLLMNTNSQDYAQTILMLLEQMRKTGFLAPNIMNVTAELE